MTVSIDNGIEEDIDYYSSTRLGNKLVWTSPQLAQGEHTLKLRVKGEKNAASNGTWITLDSAEVLNTIVDPTPVSSSSALMKITNKVYDTYSTFDIEGEKDPIITSITRGDRTKWIEYPTETTWKYRRYGMSQGLNQFEFIGRDANNNILATLNYSVFVHKLGDINGDNRIDLTDASLFAVDWGKTSNLTYSLSDMNNDNVANLTDLSILAKYAN